MLRKLCHHFRQVLLLNALLVLSCGMAAAQYGTAPNGYYPAGYGGSTYTGKAQGTGPTSITLTYAHGNKTDTFEGYASAPCSMPVSKTSTAPMPLSEVPTTAVVTVFYQSETVKVDGQKHKRNEIIAISFQQLNGKTIASEHRAIFYCTPSPVLAFKAFEGVR